MSRFEGPQGIVTNGLVLNLDAGDPDSYTRSQPPYVEVLVVAGGGAGGGYHAGGGGAGGVIYNSAYQLTSAAAITVTIGAGGGAATNISNTGDPGSNSVFGSLTAIGGGAGISQGSSPIARNNGGSGGGAADGSGGVNHPGGSGTPGQGFNGGNIFGDGPSQYYLYGTAGGGGAGGNGVGNIITGGGAGGPGSAFSISGTTTYYGGGGGGTYLGPGSLGVLTADYGIGGVGGGGRGGYTSTAGGAVVVYSTSGTNNTGGGGGGFLYANNGGGAGGSGIVIVRYPGLPAATGGTITYINGYTIHTFTSSGTFTPYLWNDVSGNGYNGTLVNGVTFNSYQNGGGLIFDGTDDYIDLQYAIIGGTGDFTVSQWLQSGPDNAGGTTFGNYSAGQLQIFFGKNYIGMYLGNNSTYLGVSPWNVTLPEFTTEPVMITATRQSSVTSFYINGVLKKNGASSTDIGAANFRIGTNTNTTERFTGRVFVTQTYNRALSSTEVTQNYNAQKTRFGL